MFFFSFFFTKKIGPNFYRRKKRSWAYMDSHQKFQTRKKKSMGLSSYTSNNFFLFLKISKIPKIFFNHLSETT